MGAGAVRSSTFGDIGESAPDRREGSSVAPGCRLVREAGSPEGRRARGLSSQPCCLTPGRFHLHVAVTSGAALQPRAGAVSTLALCPWALASPEHFTQVEPHVVLCIYCSARKCWQHGALRLPATHPAFPPAERALPAASQLTARRPGRPNASWSRSRPAGPPCRGPPLLSVPTPRGEETSFTCERRTYLASRTGHVSRRGRYFL